MGEVLLSPHNDDETLFASYLVCQHQPLVVTVLRSYVQEHRGLPITYRRREAETEAALAELSPPVALRWQQWPYPDDTPPWTEIRTRLSGLAEEHGVAFAPLPEEGGHDHHNRIGLLALDVWGPEAVVFYSTYTTNGRSTIGDLAHPDPDWIVRKLRALACYRSQIVEQSCRPHFVRGLDEYVMFP